VERRPRAGLTAQWRALLAPKRGDDAALRAIVAELSALTEERPELGRLAGAGHRDEPAHRWIAYKEAYSPGLVREILDSWSGLRGPLLDPFAGTGTTLLVAIERDLTAIGVELLPYTHWVANTLVAARLAEPQRLRELVAQAAQTAGRARRPNTGSLAAPAASWALSPEVTTALLRCRDALLARGFSPEADLAHLALLSAVDGLSTAVKDGTSLRHRERVREGRTARPGRKGLVSTATDVRDAFLLAAAKIADDLPKLPSSDAWAQVLRADARQLPLATNSVGGAVFSPPYPNRYDYSAVYQLELAVGGFVETVEELRTVRKSLLRSHLEAPAPSDPALDDPVVRSVLWSVATAAEGFDVDSGRTLRMLAGYFDDMRTVFSDLARTLRPGAPAACVVATQTYFGAALPTDVMLASLARRAGLTIEGLWTLRHKRVVVQQRARGGITSAGGRESVLLLRKPN
jgi:hypothetical protein